MQNNSPYCLFFDFDETIFINYEVPKATELAIKTAQAKGCKVYMNTGRTYNSMIKEMVKSTDIEFDGYLCCFNTIVLKGDNKPALIGKRMGNKELIDFVDYCIEKSYWGTIEVDDGDIYTIELEGDVVYTPEELEFHRKKALDFLLNKSIVKFNVYPPQSNNFNADNIKSAVKDYLWIEKARGYEGHHPGEDKGTLLKKFAEITGYDFDKFIVFGDSENDLGAFEVAKTSVAMACSAQIIKEKATYVATEKEGVAQYINEVLLKKL